MCKQPRPGHQLRYGLHLYAPISATTSDAETVFTIVHENKVNTVKIDNSAAVIKVKNDIEADEECLHATETFDNYTSAILDQVN